jgi:hypothetical protein
MACTCSCCCGACCQGTSCTLTSPGDCTGTGKVWKGGGTTCSPNVCELGACCVNGNCSQLTAAQCAAQSGVFLGAGVACSAFSCHGRCCYTTAPPQSIRECMVTSSNNCFGFNGVYYGDGTECVGFDCGRGACCTNGVCTYVFPSQCSGTFRGAGSFCTTDVCQVTGACNTSTQSGGPGVTVNYYAMPVAPGTVTFTYEAFSVPDAFRVEGGGQVLLDIPSTSTTSPVTRTFLKPAGITVVKVTVTGPSSGTGWTYTIGCPNPLP